MEFEVLHFKEHASVRWLILGPAVHRLIVIWDALENFLNSMMKDKSQPSRSAFCRLSGLRCEENESLSLFYQQRGASV